MHSTAAASTSLRLLTQSLSSLSAFSHTSLLPLHFLSLSLYAHRHLLFDVHSRKCVAQALALDVILFRGALFCYEVLLPRLVLSLLGLELRGDWRYAKYPSTAERSSQAQQPSTAAASSIAILHSPSSSSAVQHCTSSTHTLVVPPSCCTHTHRYEYTIVLFWALPAYIICEVVTTVLLIKMDKGQKMTIKPPARDAASSASASPAAPDAQPPQPQQHALRARSVSAPPSTTAVASATEAVESDGGGGSSTEPMIRVVSLIYTRLVYLAFVIQIRVIGTALGTRRASAAAAAQPHSTISTAQLCTSTATHYSSTAIATAALPQPPLT